jgi:hypothetical protein
VDEHSDIAVEEPVRTEAFLSPRRVVRWTVVVGLGIVVVLAWWQDPTYA